MSKCPLSPYFIVTLLSSTVSFHLTFLQCLGTVEVYLAEVFLTGRATPMCLFVVRHFTLKSWLVASCISFYVSGLVLLCWFMEASR